RQHVAAFIVGAHWVCPRRGEGFYETRISGNVVVRVACRAKNQCGSDNGCDRDDSDRDHSKHGQTIAQQPPHGLMKQRVPGDDLRRTQYRILGSMKAYATSTSRLQTRIVIEMNATIPRIRGSSRFRFALMK